MMKTAVDALVVARREVEARAASRMRQRSANRFSVELACSKIAEERDAADEQRDHRDDALALAGVARRREAGRRTARPTPTARPMPKTSPMVSASMRCPRR